MVSKNMETKMDTPSLLIVTNGPIENGPSRLRAYQYHHLWREAGFDVNIIDYESHSRQALDSKSVSLRIKNTDVVFLQRILDWDVLKPAVLFNKPLIFDYDDALFYVRSSQMLASQHPRSIRNFLLPYYRRIVRGHEFYSSQRRILNKALTAVAAVIVGNEYLASYTRQFNDNVYVIPTAVDVSAKPVKTIQNTLRL